MIDDLISHLKKGLLNQQATDLPRYRQLYEVLRQQILDGFLWPGVRLPSSRMLAFRLGFARNTVLTTIEQLRAEGYVSTRAGSGVYVLATTPKSWLSAKSDVMSTTPPGLSQRGRQMREDLPTTAVCGAFAMGIPDLKTFPLALWQRYVGRHGRNPKLNWQSYTYHGGHEELKQAIADYLRVTRGIRCQPGQLLITHNTQQSLRMVADLLADSGEWAWMEDPGYRGARCAFEAAGLRIVNIPVDGEGMAPAPSNWRQQSPRLIYTTPSHQYPTAVVMSAARRRQLLALSTQHQAWLLEDDYDSEFRYGGTPLAALQALAPKQVIYMGTFSKTFFPALGIAYLIVPEMLVDAFRAAQVRYQREPSYVIQKALADFIRDGHASAHIRKMRREYQTRQETLVALLQTELGNQVRLDGLDTGLHLLAYLAEPPADQVITAQLKQQGIQTKALSTSYFEKTADRSSALLLGFGDANVQDILRSGKVLCKNIHSYLEQMYRKTYITKK